MQLVNFIIVLFVSLFCLWRFNRRFNLSRRDLLIGWAIKIVFSFAFILVFSQFYGNGKLYGDAGNFMNDSRILCEFGKSNPWEYLKLLIGIGDDQTLFHQTILSETNIWSYGENGDFINDNRLIIRINSILHFFSSGNIYTHALIMSFLAYLGILLTYKSLQALISNKKLFFYSLVAFPSIAFWSAGITKESVLIFAFGLFFFGCFKLYKRNYLHAIIPLLIGVLMLLFNKPHVGLIVLSLMPIFLIGRFISWKKGFLYLIPFIVLISTIGITYTPSQVNLLDKVSYKQKDLINMGKGGVFFITDSSFCAFDYEYLPHFKTRLNNKITVLNETRGEYKLFGQHSFHPFKIAPSENEYDVYLIQPPSISYIPVTPINYNRTALLHSIPEVLHNTIVRPYPWDPGSELKYFPFASNLLLMGFVIFVGFNRKNIGVKEKYLTGYLVISALLILLLIGWTTPILGAIVRYKIAAEFLIIIALSISLKPLKNEI